MEESGKGEWTRKQTRASVPYLLPDLQLDEAEPESLVGAVRQGPWAVSRSTSHRRMGNLKETIFIFLPYVLEKRQQNMIFYLFLAGCLFYYFYLFIYLFIYFFLGGGIRFEIYLEIINLKTSVEL